MATISDSSRRFVDAQLAGAAREIEAARQSVRDDQMNFDRALRVLDECRSAVRATEDIDAVAMHLRAASRALEHFCAGPTNACVSSALKLLDRAIGGETF
jgi:hypothetical protein